MSWIDGKREEELTEEEINMIWTEGEKDLAKEDMPPGIEDSPAGGDSGDEGNEGLPAGIEAPATDINKDGKDITPVSKDHGTLEQTEKALKDTKAHATKLAQENAELKRLVDQQRQGNATKKEVDDQKQAVKDALSNFKTAAEGVYEDYPELKQTFEPLYQIMTDITGKVEKFEKRTVEDEEGRRRQQMLTDFNTNIKPKILEKHPDYDKVLGIDSATGRIDKETFDDYNRWATSQRPALSFAALNSDDPEDISWAIGEFKKFKATPEAQRIRNDIAERKKSNAINAQTLRGGSTAFPQRKVTAGDDDPEALWEEAGKTLKKEGIGRG